MEDDDIRKYLKDNWKAFLETCGLDQLISLREEFLDILIGIMPFLVNSEERIGKKDKLRRKFMEICADRHGV